MSRHRWFSIEALTGTIAAASNGPVFAMRYSPTATRRLYVARLELDYCCIVAFTTPVTQRRLVISRGSGAACTGGNALDPIELHDSADPVCGLSATPAGGDVRVASTAALGVAGITFETLHLGSMVLTQNGAANSRLQQAFEFRSGDANIDLESPILLRPGELLAVRTSAAFDAAGTWQLGVNVHGYEADPSVIR